MYTHSEDLLILGYEKRTEYKRIFKLFSGSTSGIGMKVKNQAMKIGFIHLSIYFLENLNTNR